MVRRLYIKKSSSLDEELREFLKFDVEKVEKFIRYDVEDIDDEIYEKSLNTVFCEPMVDELLFELPKTDALIIASEFLPGQFDQRADSCQACIQMLGQQNRPEIKTADIYFIYGNLSEEEKLKLKDYLINPVESREASLEKKDTLKEVYNKAQKVEVLKDFIDLKEADLSAFVEDMSLAMDSADLKCVVDYFKSLKRNPTITELKVLDTYWSDHCRHTTFNTHLENIEIEDDEVKRAFNRYLEIRKTLKRDNRPITLMDIATIGAKYIDVKNLDVSDEINACSVEVEATVDGKRVPYLMMFKNETHNHPTEIEPFGGAATCIGGAIRDPLSGRSYVYQAMRITGCANPLEKVEDTIEGKLPQRKIAITAAQGNSSYGNQIGLATGLVDEIYHDGYKAKHLELGAVVAATPKENVRREKPQSGDCILLVGGRTGRDGIGGATGSSKSHNLESLEKSGAEVQKGNAPEERKLQRLFRTKEATVLIKKCNDFGAGGVAVAIGELADGLEIDLDQVKTKYKGLDATEIAISESQERMAVVVEEKDVEHFSQICHRENLEVTQVAVVTEKPNLVMKKDGEIVVNIERSFLDTNGSSRKNDIKVLKESAVEIKNENIKNMFSSLNYCSREGLAARFDSTIGASSVLFPYGGKYQKSPEQCMSALFPAQGECDTCSIMSYGFDPRVMENSPYQGAYESVVSSVAKVISSGGHLNTTYLSLQEYFGKVDNNAIRFGKPFAALLGALNAQLDLQVAAIGGKDSMSGSFGKIDVPNTLVSIAISPSNADRVIPTVFNKSGNTLYLIEQQKDETLREHLLKIEKLIDEKKIVSSYALTRGYLKEAICKMSFGNRIGIDLCVNLDDYDYKLGSVLVESSSPISNAILIGTLSSEFSISLKNEKIDLVEIQKVSDNYLSSVYPLYSKKEFKMGEIESKTYSYKTNTLKNKPKVLIPVFPGTNCEIDSLNAVNKAGAEGELFIVRNQNADDIKWSIKEFAARLNESNVLYIPGGFSAGDEPDGSGKYICSFLRSPLIKDAIENLLENRDGLALGICNGFQALIKLGLVPYGKIVEPNENNPTLTFNNIPRHISRLVTTKVVNNNSPWFNLYEVGEVIKTPISHGEGRFVANDEVLKSLIENGQVASQYCDLAGNIATDGIYNPNGSTYSIEAITSKDGRVFGRMAHSERSNQYLYKNCEYKEDDRLFKSMVRYFK